MRFTLLRAHQLQVSFYELGSQTKRRFFQYSQRRSVTCAFARAAEPRRAWGQVRGGALISRDSLQTLTFLPSYTCVKASSTCRLEQSFHGKFYVRKVCERVKKSDWYFIEIQKLVTGIVRVSRKYAMTYVFAVTDARIFRVSPLSVRCFMAYSPLNPNLGNPYRELSLL